MPNSKHCPGRIRETIPASDAPILTHRSSIDQFESFLSVYKKGGAMPIAFNILETASCDGITTRRVIAKAGTSFNGYIYPSASCMRSKEQYIVSDFQGKMTRVLPLCQGYKTEEDEEGCVHIKPYTYEQFVDEKILPLAKNGPLKTASSIKYRVGLDYYQTNKRLTPER